MSNPERGALAATQSAIASPSPTSAFAPTRLRYAVESEHVVYGAFTPDGARFEPAKRDAAAPAYTLARPFRSAPRPPPRRPPAVGYCAPTEDDNAGDCTDGHKGMWRMGAGGPGVADLDACAERCWRVCPRCRFVSASARNRDCSWFHECDVARLHLEWSGDTYRTVVVVAGR